MEYAIRHKIDNLDAETGSFASEAEALRWWESWSADNPQERIREWKLVERDTGRVVASHDAAVADPDE